MKFKYLTNQFAEDSKGNLVKRPVVEVVLGYHGTEREALGIIDSGADMTTMSTSIAELLGIDWRACPKRSLMGISGNVQPSYLATVELTIKAIGETLEVPVSFTEADIPILIGEETFFDTYRIRFEKDRDTFEIVRSQRS